MIIISFIYALLRRMERSCQVSIQLRQCSRSTNAASVDQGKATLDSMTENSHCNTKPLTVASLYMSHPHLARPFIAHFNRIKQLHNHTQRCSRISLGSFVKLPNFLPPRLKDPSGETILNSLNLTSRSGGLLIAPAQLKQETTSRVVNIVV